MPGDLSTSDIDWKKQVAVSFGQAVDSYERNALVQRRVAESLARRILETVDPDQIDDALEIGCGTGFLTRPLLKAFNQSRWTISDISTQMIEYCRNHPEWTPESKSHVEFVQADGELLDGGKFDDRQFDLICSSLTFQWFVDLPAALSQLMKRVKPGGWFFFTTLDTDNFSKIAQRFPCLDQRINKSVAASMIRETLEAGGRAEVSTSSFICNARYADLGEFLGSLKAIGAGVSRNATEVDRSGLRSALIQSKQSGEPVLADYRVLLVAAQKKATR